MLMMPPHEDRRLFAIAAAIEQALSRTR